MNTWSESIIGFVWHASAAAIPMAIGVVVLTRTISLRPATRHLLWLTVLGWMFIGPFLPGRSTDMGDTLKSLTRVIDSSVPTGSAANTHPDADPVQPQGRSSLTVESRTVTDGPVLHQTAVHSGPSMVDAANRSEGDSAVIGGTRLPKPPSTVRESRALPDLNKLLPTSATTIPMVPSPETVTKFPPLPTGTIPNHQPQVRFADQEPLPSEVELIHPVTGERARDSIAVERPIHVAPPTSNQDSDLKGFHSRPSTVAGVRPSSQATVTTRRVQEPAWAIQTTRNDREIDSRGFRGEFTEAASAWITHAWRQSAATISGWIGAVAALYTAILALPRIPSVLWISGAAWIMLLRWLNYRRSRVLRDGATPVEESVQRWVQSLGNRMGLRRAPRTFWVESRISPMIWCDRTPKLLLPRELWGNLDRSGRQAVILHELAHLRRRDHLTAWIDLIAGSVYWWHPVVWLARSRLRAEADACCDAWVTWLMPQARRNYAEALLKATAYVGSEQTRVPVKGIAMVRGGAKRLSRRITMVMTQSLTPRHSMAGVGCALLMSTLGWLALPARSCPPDGGPEHQCAKGRKGCQTPCGPCPDHQVGREFASNTGPATGRLSFLLAAAGDEGDENGDRGSVEDRIEQLERRMDRVLELLEQRVAGQGSRDGRGVGRSSDRRRPMPPPRAERIPPPPPTPPPPGQDVQTGEGSSTYELPGGKLEPLMALMVRADVPVRVRPRGDSIEVFGSPVQQEIFQGFVNLIHPVVERRRYSPSPGKLDPLGALMARPDVPILVEPDEDHIVVHATATGHAAFAAFVEMIDPGHGESESLGLGRAVPPTQGRPVPAIIREEVGRARQKIHEKMRDVRRERKIHRKRSGARAETEADQGEIMSALADLVSEEQLGALMAQIHDLPIRGEMQRAVAEASRVISEALAQDPSARRTTLEELAAHLEMKSESLGQGAEDLHERAMEFEHQQENLEREAEEINHRVEVMEEHAHQDTTDEVDVENEGDPTMVDGSVGAGLVSGHRSEAETAALWAHLADLQAQAAPLESQSMKLEVEAESIQAHAELFAEIASAVRELISMDDPSEDHEDERSE